MGQQSQIDQLIDDLYETAVSAVDACVWCDLLPGFCSTFDAAAGSLIDHDFVSGTATLRHGYSADGRGRGHRDGEPWRQELTLDCLSGYREGAVFGGEGCVHQLCGMITREEGSGYLISMARPAGAEPFGGDDKDVLARLLPHLKRSLQLRDEVMHGRVERESLLDLMDQLPVAVLLVSRSGLVRLRNQAADALLGRRDGICLRAGYLAGGSARTTAELRRLIANAAGRSPDGDAAASAEHVVIARGPDRLPLISVAHPGRAGDGADGRAEPMVVVLIKDPQADSGGSIADFIKAYGITRAEARLLCILGNGHGLFEAATELGISRNTARTHMRSIYAKVGTHRQSDLVRLLHRFNLF